VVFHYCFSHLGYNSSDDGVVLAGAKRILQGEFPHRDFIQIRPFGSNYLWAPVVYILTGLNIPLIYWTRLIVWLQFFVISFVWVMILNHRYLKFKAIYLFPIIVVSTMISSHNFPIMPWTTIDGLFFIAVGYYLYYFSDNKWLTYLGLLLFGSCFWFKQNYLFVFLVLFVYLLYKRCFQALVFLMLPTIISLFVLTANHAISPFIEQIISRGNNDLINVGLLTYSENAFLLPYRFITLSEELIDPRMIGFILFYFVLAMFLFIEKKDWFLGLMIIIIGWSSSISIGYNTPILFAGTYFTFIFLFFYLKQKKLLFRENQLRFIVLSLFLLIAIAPYYTYYRLNNIYRDLSAKYLDYDLGEIYYDFKLIKTNKHMFNYFVDLKKTYNFYSKKTQVAIMPSTTGFWLTTKAINPLNIDWVNDYEHPSINQTQSIIRKIKSNKTLTLFVNKYFIEYLYQGKIKPRRESIVADFVEENASLIDETEYFKIYRFN
jgi:hypothetical protein